MKAFLMHRDRDFDPAMLLARREKELRYHRSSDQGLSLQPMLPWNEEALRHDLGLNVLFAAMAAADKFLAEVAQVALLSPLTELSAIRYRQHVLADSLANAQIVRDIYQVATDAIEAEKKNYYLSTLSRYPAATLHRAVEVLQMFVGALRKLRQIADRHAPRFRSQGYSRLFAMLRDELNDEYFVEIDRHLYRLRFRQGALISAQLGGGNTGTNYVLRKPNDDNRSWLRRLVAEKPPGFTFQLHPRDEAGARALSTLNDRGVNPVANALAQSTDHILGFFQMLRTELAFYIGCINLHERLAALGEPLCLPELRPAGERMLSFRGLYDAALALTMERKVVGNDLDADRSDIVVITGANTGGKSTFLRSIGIAQLMMQAGMFVPAESFSGEVCDGVMTLYRREEDATMESGKLDEELGRMSEIVDRLRPNALMLFNEAFASTNEREGSEIAGLVVDALLDRGVKVFYVTHLYHFAHSLFGRQRDSVTFLRAERRPDGTRPFKLVRGEPLQTSYGEDLYRAIFAGDQAASRARNA